MAKQKVTIYEAAQILETSPDAIRMRIRRGALEGGKEGNRVYVLLDENLTESKPEVNIESSALISEMRLRIEDLKDQLEQANERDREARRLLAAALERIPPQLEAPSEPPQSPEPTPDATEGVEHRPASGGEHAPSEVRRSWWSRVFGDG